MRNVSLDDYDRIARPVLAIGTDYTPGHVLDWHRHRRAQLLYGATGVMIVETVDGAWTVPTDRAILIPPATRHRVTMLGVSTRSLYLEPSAVAPWWPASCRIADVPPLVRELLLAAVELDPAYDEGGRDGALAALLLHELAALSTRPSLPLHIDLPASPELAALCRGYLTAPDVRLRNEDWARRLATSERAFTRRFRRELGTSPAAWRARARLVAAVPLLREHSVTGTAARLGYSSPAAFTAAFSRAFGLPPSVFNRPAP
ncbi:AraC family transcriptional regulator [Phaeacidiphilus oryzae]|uniref:AraC family transcriptional regulator n=1 Tax=Phaeacidiphilus oryzae TaxID=348818 RepID=UPI0005678647|nr:helix-turn-helix transcriptional regulator [Phaeacidiphilus oryzae]